MASGNYKQNPKYIRLCALAFFVIIMAYLDGLGHTNVFHSLKEKDVQLSGKTFNKDLLEKSKTALAMSRQDGKRHHSTRSSFKQVALWLARENGSIVEVFVIDPNTCTECVGFHDEEQCAVVCPVDCCVPDPNNEEAEELLLERAREIHPDMDVPKLEDLTPDLSRFRN